MGACCMCVVDTGGAVRISRANGTSRQHLRYSGIGNKVSTMFCKAHGIILVVQGSALYIVVY
jgi:hypothetical protein